MAAPGRLHSLPWRVAQPQEVRGLQVEGVGTVGVFQAGDPGVVASQEGVQPCERFAKAVGYPVGIEGVPGVDERQQPTTLRRGTDQGGQQKSSPRRADNLGHAA